MLGDTGASKSRGQANRLSRLVRRHDLSTEILDDTAGLFHHLGI